MFIKNDDLLLLRNINEELNNEKLKSLIDRLEDDMNNNNITAKDKIGYMRNHGYPYYARPKAIQEKHYKKYFKEIKYYIEQNEINVAMIILKRIIKENSYSAKQLDYFMETIPQEIIEIYNECEKSEPQIHGHYDARAIY